MGLKMRLEWFDRTTERLRGTEDSADLGNDYSVISKLGLSIDEDVNNGMFELRREWLSQIQTHFSHEIALSESDYFIAFDYEGANE
ncbi:colicin E3-like toxin immunity protein [Pseudomonas marginalis]|uniref:Colicin transporter n=2 Tax=Pseudomonas TaxID=286 RepID=A0A9X9FVP1_PSEMA|nr:MULTISPECIES: colicin E3-like toxin immunity protein [Pseudomonas]MDT9634730.1 colicin transporter [Pseudomonas sp. JV449]TKJ75978.1 colicin transporter [Pseudomonas sp. CFBP13509]TWR53358.1 colicin transporter [Pseudomonas marginalis]SAM31939.1 Microcin-E3 immunity protein [Pseudomonas sp. 1 R 17]SED20203.1 Cloacin immunity protein [Pseudomonas marginalis]